VADGDRVDDLVPDDPRIRLIYTEEEGHRKIGPKRNFANEQAMGDLIAHFDDDDWSGPTRIARQVAFFLESAKPVSGFQRMRFTNGDRSWLYEGDPLYAVGTSLLYTRQYWSTHRFAHLQIGEDGNFVRAAIAERNIAVMDAGDLMFATIHDSNTSPRKTTGCNWKPL
jgi:hypothetical protein